VLGYAKKAGASSLLFLTLDRPVHSWVKLSVQCFDMTGSLLWEAGASDSGWLHTGKPDVLNVIKETQKQLARRIGGPGLPVQP
jgi:hypothetical protein